MRTLFVPSLIDGPRGDPGLFVDLQDEGRAVLLDLGRIGHLPARKLLRVDHAIVSHCHMDHFMGFDVLLRLALGRERELVVTGPAGFLEAVRGRIAAYTWNLVDGYPIRLRIQEVDGEVVRSESYSGASRMRPIAEPSREFHGVVHAERLFTLHADVLDHWIPVLGACLREVEHLAVDPDRLAKLGLVPGSWLRDLKQHVRRGDPDTTQVMASTSGGSTAVWTLGELAPQILHVGEGQRIGYVTDVAFHESNLERIARLVVGCDLLVCEAAFLQEDFALAAERHHLTARQAGEVARRAGARRLVIFHISPRYEGREAELFEEAERAFGGPVLRL